MSLSKLLQNLLLESIGLAVQCLFAAGIVLIPSLAIWWLSPLDLFSSLLIVYGIYTAFALLFQVSLTLTRRATETQPPENKAINEIISIASRGSSGLEPVSIALQRFAHGLLWPALLIHRFRHIHDYPILRERFGVPVAKFLFPSDVVLAILTACVAVLICAQQSSSLPVRIVLIGCLAQVTARHLAYALSPVSLTDVLRQVSGNVFVKLLLVGICDLVTLTAIYAAWMSNAWVLPTPESFVGTIVRVLKLEDPIESVFGVNSPLRDRLRTLSTMLYYLAVGRLIWPPKNLARTKQDLIGIGARLMLQGKYDEALQWLRAIRERDMITTGLVAICHLGKGELEDAIVYAKSRAPSAVSKTDFCYFVLFNGVHMLELPDRSMDVSRELRSRLRASMQEKTNRLLLDHAAESEITDGVMWFGFVSFSIFEPAVGASRDETVAALLKGNRFPLSRVFATFEVIEQEYDFACKMEEEGLNLEGLEDRKAALEDQLRKLHNVVLKAKTQNPTDGLLKHCMVLLLSSYAKNQVSEWDAYASKHLNQMKQLLDEMQNDLQRILAIQILLIFDCFILRPVKTTEFTHRLHTLSRQLHKLSRQAAIRLEADVPLWAEILVDIIRQHQRSLT